MNIKSIIQLWSEPAYSLNGFKYYDFNLVFSDGFGNHCVMSTAAAHRLAMATKVKVLWNTTEPALNQQEDEDLDHHNSAELQEYWEESWNKRNPSEPEFKKVSVYAFPGLKQTV